MPYSKFYTPNEVAELLQISKSHANNLFHQGGFNVYRIGKSLRVCATDLEAWLNEQKTPVKTSKSKKKETYHDRK